MANIAEYLRKILLARKGEEVRSSIHDSIKAMNDEIEEDLGGMIEDGNDVIEAMQEEIQSVETMKENGELNMKPEDLSEQQWADLKTDLTNYYKRYESTYLTTEANETNIPINISQYNTLAILEVYVEGRILNRGEYTINGTHSITLVTPLSIIGTKVHFVVYRSVCATNQDIVNLKGDKGDSGAVVFDNVADMKADTDLVAGDTCQTLGYYSANDGGAGLYKIVDDDTLVDDGGSIHDLENGLKATLIIEEFVNILQLGAKNDGSEDTSNIINNAFNHFKKLYFPIGKYKIDNTIDLKNKSNITVTGESHTTYKNDNSTIFIGNTGNNPIFNLLGAIYINFNNFSIFSDDNTLSSPSVLGILQGCTSERQFSQWIYFTNIHINLISSPNSNNMNGSIGIYNYQSELNDFINCFVYADVPIAFLQDDDFGIATSFGAILPAHDSLTGNNYVNLETQSKLKYTACLSGGGITFTGFYGQGCLKFFTNSRNDNQVNNFTVMGVIENNNNQINDSAIEIGTNARLQNSLIQLSCVGYVHYIESETNGVLTANILKLVGNLTGSYAPTNTRFQNNLIFKGNINIENLYSQGNIVLGGNFNTSIENANLSIMNDGTLVYSKKGIIFTNSKPSRTDLPNQSIAFNLANNNFMAWKYSSNNQEWLPVAPSRPIESDTGSINGQTPQLIGQLLHDVNTNDMYIAFGTSQGNWKKIT